MRIFNFIILFVIVISFWSCGDDDKVNPPLLDYDDIIASGWTEFGNQNYSEAIENFNSAKTMEPEDFASYNGLGWAYFKTDQLTNSINEFTQGSEKTGAIADISAGWAFVLNADKKYAESNLRIDDAFTMDPNWTFTNGLSLNSNHLLLLRAENFYLLGNFGESLNAIQELNTSFLANILTSEGRAALALEIERLKEVL